MSSPCALHIREFVVNICLVFFPLSARFDSEAQFSSTVSHPGASERIRISLNGHYVDITSCHRRTGNMSISGLVLDRLIEIEKYGP